MQTIQQLLMLTQMDEESKDEIRDLMEYEREFLVGAVSLFSLIISDKDTKLYNIMTAQPKSLRDTDTIEDALSIMQKYNLICLL